MRSIMRLLALVLGMLILFPLPLQAETGLLQVTVGGVPHTIGYSVFIDQQVNDLSDPARFLFREGVGVSMDVSDSSSTRIIQKVSVGVPPSPELPEGAKFEVPLSNLDPGQTGVDFFLGLAYPPPADMESFEFVIHLTTGDKIKIAPFPITLYRLSDLQNVQFLDNTTKPVITWDSLAGVQNYRVKVQDPDTGLSVFVTNTFPAASGGVQTLDLKAPPTGGSPIGWTGMEIGKMYVIRVEGRLLGSNLVPQFVTLPFPKHTSVPGPSIGQGQITRSMRRVEYTPLELAP